VASIFVIITVIYTSSFFFSAHEEYPLLLFLLMPGRTCEDPLLPINCASPGPQAFFSLLTRPSSPKDEPMPFFLVCLRSLPFFRELMLQTTLPVTFVPIESVTRRSPPTPRPFVIILCTRTSARCRFYGMRPSLHRNSARSQLG